MLALSSLGPVTITMKNGLMAHGLYLSVCEGISAWVCMHIFVYVFHLTILISLLVPTSLFLVSICVQASNSLRENGKQSEANCRAAAARHTQVEGEVLRALTGRSLVVSEQQLADGCGEEMIHADSTVSVSVP